MSVALVLKTAAFALRFKTAVFALRWWAKMAVPLVLQHLKTVWLALGELGCGLDR